MQTKLESRRVVVGMSGEGETAERDQQALRGNRIGDQDAYEGRQKSLDLPNLMIMPHTYSNPQH